MIDGQSAAPGVGQPSAPALAENFREADAERLRSSLSQADSENLEMITNKIISAQSAAAGQSVQLMVTPPLRGRVLEFTRPLQVDLFDEMTVSFDADRIGGRVWQLWLPTLLVSVGLFVLMLVTATAARQWPTMREWLTPGDNDDLWTDEVDGPDDTDDLDDLTDEDDAEAPSEI
ncbi:MAG: hypothetical protein CMJ49_07865 [Planctomycetaceae bacterium]|nr:hypothetical protein [Planctomycetaceae bacterium]